MPVVNTANFVDRLREITRRIDIRPGLQNVSKRWHTIYDTLAVGSPQQVQEFYKYIKVYKQCPANDLLFMNMTVQLARASMFPTKSMFKQMLKFEKHMDGLILQEGFHGIYGFRGIEILCGHNEHLLKNYRRFKRHSETKKADREMKTARKNAKQMAALRDVRAKSNKGGLYEIPVYNPMESLVPGDGPIPARTPQSNETTPTSTEAHDKIAEELYKVKKYCEVLKSQMEEAEKRREEDDVASKLNEVVEKLISGTTNDSEDGELMEEKEKDKEIEEQDEDEGVESGENLNEEEEEEEDPDDHLVEDEELETPKLPDFMACNITEQQRKAIMRILLGVTEDETEEGVVEVAVEEMQEESDDEEELEKIDDKDVDAMEYEML